MVDMVVHRHELRPAFGRVANLYKLHPVGFGRQFLPIGRELPVIRETVVVAQVEAEVLLGGSDCRGRRGGREPDEQ